MQNLFKNLITLGMYSENKRALERMRRRTRSKLVNRFLPNEFYTHFKHQLRPIRFVRDVPYHQVQNDPYYNIEDYCILEKNYWKNGCTICPKWMSFLRIYYLLKSVYNGALHGFARYLNDCGYIQLGFGEIMNIRSIREGRKRAKKRANP